jgi:hypothetical protein
MTDASKIIPRKIENKIKLIQAVKELRMVLANV